MTKRRYLALALGFSLLMICPQWVLASSTEQRLNANYSSDLLIYSGEYKAFIVHLVPGNKMNLTVRVGLGDSIDVFTLSMEDYENYKAGAKLFEYYSQFTREDLKYFEYSTGFDPVREDDYVVVIDNLDKSPTGASGATDVSCSITVDLQFKNSTKPAQEKKEFLPGFEIGMIMISLCFAMVLIERRWRDDQ